MRQGHIAFPSGPLAVASLTNTSTTGRLSRTLSAGKEQWRCYVAQREQSQMCCWPSVVCQIMGVRMLGAWEVTRGLRARKWRRKGFKFEGAQAIASDCFHARLLTRTVHGRSLQAPFLSSDYCAAASLNRQIRGVGREFNSQRIGSASRSILIDRGGGP